MFIVFEGIDGSGKGTQIRLLVEFLRARGKQVLTTFEPTDNEIGQEIRKILREHQDIGMIDLQKMYCSDRANHLKREIKPALEQGKIVICDRYHDSTIAFGMLAMGKDVLEEMGNEFLKPDLTILLDVDPEVAMQRIEKRGETKELFEKLEKLKKVRENYLSLENVKIINGNRTVEEIFEDVKKLVLDLI